MQESNWENEGGLVTPEQAERLADSFDTSTPVVIDENSLVIISLLMRLYDIQMALLSEMNKDLADSIYDTHALGGHFNPQIFIPNVSTGGTES